MCYRLFRVRSQQIRSVMTLFTLYHQQNKKTVSILHLKTGSLSYSTQGMEKVPNSPTYSKQQPPTLLP